MIERAERLRFSLESREAVRIGREMGRQKLQCGVAVQPGITRAIHLAHAAGSDKVQDLVNPDLPSAESLFAGWRTPLWDNCEGRTVEQTVAGLIGAE